MIMNSEDEKFFEDLSAGAKPEADSEYAVELVKAGGSTLSASPATARPKIIRTKDEKEDLWNDGEPEGQLTVDVYQTASDIVVESAIAGVDPDDIDVNVTTDSIFSPLAMT